MGGNRSARWLAIAVAALALCGAGVALATIAMPGDGADRQAPVAGRTDHGGWRLLPEPAGGRAAGLSELRGVRIGGRVVVVAGASYRTERVEALVYDLRRDRWSWAPPAPLRWRAGMSVVAARGAHGYAVVWGGATNRAAADAHGARYDPGLGARGARRLGAWKRIATAPIAPRAFHSAVWAGSRMIVWGGAGEPYVPGRTRRLLGDGAAYDPGRDRWTRIARGPLRPRSGHVAVWTGARMIVWGGEVDRDGRRRAPRAEDGAIYDPARDRWTTMARAPLRWTPGAQAIWDGERMLIWTGRVAAAYRPATDRWEPNRWVRWPRPPLAADRAGHVAVGLGGGGLFVWGGCCAGSRQLASGAVYRPGPLLAAEVGRDLAATCRAIAAPRTAVRCPTWLPAPPRRDGTPAFHVGNRDLNRSACGYLTELHLRSAPPGAPAATGRYPFHVWFGGRCEPFPIEADDGRWPPVPGRRSYLGLVGVDPATPGRRARERLVRPRVFAATSVRGRTALVLAVAPYPRGGLHGGHYAIVWNAGGDGYAVSLHLPGGDRGRDPSPRQIRTLNRAAASMRAIR